MYTVYILYSLSADKFYVGHTGEEINERIRKHLSNHDGFTSLFKDWELKYTEKFETKPHQKCGRVTVLKEKHKVAKVLGA
jgi:putative endonuclease